MSKTLDELHKIREQIYEEEKNLPKEKVLKNLHERVEKILKERKINLKKLERKTTTIK